jgi:hypothetical protein
MEEEEEEGQNSSATQDAFNESIYVYMEDTAKAQERNKQNPGAHLPMPLQPLSSHKRKIADSSFSTALQLHQDLAPVSRSITKL